MSNNIYSGYFLEKNLEYALKLKYKVHCIIINAKENFVINKNTCISTFKWIPEGEAVKTIITDHRVIHNNLYVFGLVSNEIHSVGVIFFNE